MTLELKRNHDEFFHVSTEPYRLGGVKDITDNTPYGDGHFAITIFDTRVFLTSCFEYVKYVETGEYFVKHGMWVKGVNDDNKTVSEI